MSAPAQADTTRKRRSWRSLLVPALLGFAVLLALGIWQVERRAWKDGLITELSARLAAAPIQLPPSTQWRTLDPADDEFRRVAFTGTFEPGKEALVYGIASAFRPDVPASVPGYWVFAPARLADGTVVMVNRGFAPETRKDEVARLEGRLAGPIEIVGAMRWPDPRRWFSPADDPVHRLWFTRDPQAMAAAAGIGAIAPFYVEQESPVPPGGWPQPGRIVVRLANNHLQYAVTWFGLALVLAVVFAVWAFSGRHEAPR